MPIQLTIRSYSVKKIMLITISIILVTLTGCKKNHVKIVEKMLANRDESTCSMYMNSLYDELYLKKNYVWNGDEVVLSINDELGNLVNLIIQFHQKNHQFKNKNGEFDSNAWNNWMYYYNDTDSLEIPICTNCFICKIQNNFENKIEFEESLNDYDFKDLLYKSHYGMEIKANEEKLTHQKRKELAELSWMENCVITYTDYIYYSPKKINDFFKDFPSNVKVEKEINGKNLIITVRCFMGEDEILSLYCEFPCSKILNGGSCYLSKITLSGLGQSMKDEVYGDAYNDPEGAARCLGILEQSLRTIKALKF